MWYFNHHIVSNGRNLLQSHPGCHGVICLLSLSQSVKSACDSNNCPGSALITFHRSLPSQTGGQTSSKPRQWSETTMCSVRSHCGRIDHLGGHRGRTSTNGHCRPQCLSVTLHWPTSTGQSQEYCVLWVRGAVDIGVAMGQRGGHAAKGVVPGPVSSPVTCQLSPATQP